MVICCDPEWGLSWSCPQLTPHNYFSSNWKKKKKKYIYIYIYLTSQTAQHDAKYLGISISWILRAGKMNIFSVEQILNYWENEIKFANCNFFKVKVPFRCNHCDHLPHVPKNLATSLHVSHPRSGECPSAWSSTKIVCYLILGCCTICKLLYEAQPLLTAVLLASFIECSIVLQVIISSYLSTFFSFTCGSVLKECFLK